MDIPEIGNTDVVNEIGCQGAENDFIIQLESTSFSKMLEDAQRLDPVACDLRSWKTGIFRMDNATNSKE